MTGYGNSPSSPDHSYFPRSPRIFRKSLPGATNTTLAPLSEIAAGKAREQSTPRQTTTSAVFQPSSSRLVASDVEQHNETARDSQFLLDSPATTIPADSNTSTEKQASHKARLARTHQLRRIDKFTGYILGLFSVCLSVIMDGILAYVLHKFYTTKDIPAPGREGPWAVGTQLWPAYMLLAASSLTFLIDGLTMIAACFTFRNQKTAKEHAARAESTLVVCGYIAFVAKWFTIAVLYRTGKTGKDLWGWSCDTRAANIQMYYVNDLNFAVICKVQTAAWAMSLTEMVLKAILIGVVFWLAYKLRQLKKESHWEGESKGKEIGYDGEIESKQVMQRPPSVIWLSAVEAAKALGQSGK